MASDASIYTLLKPPAPLPDPLEQYGKLQNLQALMGQNRLQGLQTQVAQDSLDSTNRLRDLYTGGKTPTDAEIMGADPIRGTTILKSRLEMKKAQSDLDKNDAQLPGIQQDTINKATAAHRDQLADVNDPQSAAQWLQVGYQDKTLGPVLSKLAPLEQALTRIPTDPAQFQQWKQQQALGATKYIELNKPNISTQNLGGTSQVVATPGLGGTPSVLSSTARTASPDALMTDKRDREIAAQTDKRARDIAAMTDARQRELNGIMEGQGPTDLTPTATAIANHELPMPSPPSGSRNPMAMVRYNDLVQKVKAVNPDYNAQDYPTAQAALTAFAKGKQGDSTRFISTAADHVNTLREMAGALKNGNIQLFNKVANVWAEQTGQPAPTNWDTARTIVGGEVVKGIVGAGGGVEDRAKAQSAFDRAKSPAQIDDAIKVAILPLLNGQLKGLEQQYKAGTGRKDFREKYLTEGARKAFGGSSVDAAATGTTHPDFPGFSIVKKP